VLSKVLNEYIKKKTFRLEEWLKWWSTCLVFVGPWVQPQDHKKKKIRCPNKNLNMNVVLYVTVRGNNPNVQSTVEYIYTT
jgi:hypothetical protein